MALCQPAFKTLLQKPFKSCPEISSVFPHDLYSQICLGFVWLRYLPRLHCYWLSPCNEWAFGWSHTTPSGPILTNWAEWLNERLTRWPLESECHRRPCWVPASQNRALPAASRTPSAPLTQDRHRTQYPGQHPPTRSWSRSPRVAGWGTSLLSGRVAAVRLLAGQAPLKATAYRKARSQDPERKGPQNTGDTTRIFFGCSPPRSTCAHRPVASV